jgi:hypothetical protein
MQEKLSYSEIQVNGQYKLDARKICIIDKHVAMILNRDISGPSTYEERIIYYFVDDEYTNRSSPFKILTITY